MQGGGREPVSTKAVDWCSRVVGIQRNIPAHSMCETAGRKGAAPVSEVLLSPSTRSSGKEPGRPHSAGSEPAAKREVQAGAGSGWGGGKHGWQAACTVLCTRADQSGACTWCIWVGLTGWAGVGGRYVWWAAGWATLCSALLEWALGLLPSKDSALNKIQSSASNQLDASAA